MHFCFIFYFKLRKDPITRGLRPLESRYFLKSIFITKRPDYKGIVLVASRLRGEFASQMRETLQSKLCYTSKDPITRGGGALNKGKLLCLCRLARRCVYAKRSDGIAYAHTVIGFRETAFRYPLSECTPIAMFANKVSEPQDGKRPSSALPCVVLNLYFVSLSILF